MERVPAALICLTLLAPAGVCHDAQAADDVLIYHCTDQRGRVSVRDTPCPKDQRQDARRMLRPQDPPPRAVTPEAPPAAPAAAQVPPRVVFVQPPRPMYECVTPDGERYTSDIGDGRPRYVPLWTLGYPAVVPIDRPGRSPRTPARDERRQPRTDIGLRPRPWLPAFAGSTFVRDACHVLPQAEACDRLRDERDALRTRAFNAQQRERDAIRLEERALNARLANDCSIH